MRMSVIGIMCSLTLTLFVFSSNDIARQMASQSPNAQRIMPRKLVKYMPSQDVKWEPFSVTGTPTGRKARYLARGDGNDAFTAVVEYPAGYRIQSSGSHTTLTDLFILEGELKISGKRCGQYTFVSIPAGTVYGPIETENGTTVLTMQEGRPDFLQASANGSPDNLLIMDTTKVEWAALGVALIGDTTQPYSKTNPKFAPVPGSAVKILRYDEETGDTVAIFSGVPGWHSPKPEFHPTWEEAFFIQGDLEMANSPQYGNLGPGAYHCHPAFYSHGPYSTKNGVTLIERYNAGMSLFYVSSLNQTIEENRGAFEGMMKRLGWTVDKQSTSKR
jgi:hypothetical protein